MSTPNGSAFRIVLSAHVRNKLKELHRRARDAGRGRQVISAFERILTQLRSAAFEFGEPRFVLTHLNLEVRVGIVPPLLVAYGVHREQRIVFIQDFLPAPGSGL